MMLLDEIKILLGDAAANYTDAQINLAAKMALLEVETYCNREADETLELMAERIAVIKLLRSNTEGLSSLSMSGVSESYINGYPEDIMAVLRRKRLVRVL
jgi:hypothetical protein